MDFQNILKASLKNENELKECQNKKMIHLGVEDAEENISMIKDSMIEKVKKGEIVIDEMQTKKVICKQAIAYGLDSLFDDLSDDLSVGYRYLKWKYTDERHITTHGVFKTYEEIEWVRKYEFYIDFEEDIRSKTFFNTLQELALKDKIDIEFYLVNKKSKEEYKIPAFISVSASGDRTGPYIGYHYDSPDYWIYIKATCVIE